MSDITRPLAQARVGDVISEVKFPLSVYRLVMWAGANRDFNSIHHNTEYAQSTGAPEMYANTLFLMGMWERAVRDWAGAEARITAIRGFRMRRFTTVGETATVRGTVTETRLDGAVVLELSTSDSQGITVGPGSVEIMLPNAS